MEQNIGIYMWTSPSGKSYIGQSVDLRSRKKKFLCFSDGYSGSGKVGSKKFKYNRINCARLKYNRKEDWVYEILEYCTENELDERERYWISFFNTVEEGYNLDSGGKGKKRVSENTKKKISETLKGHIVAQDTKKKISETLKGHIPWNKGKSCGESKNRKPVLQYDLDGNFIREWDFIADASKELGIDRVSISSVCRGKRKSVGGYMWRFYEGGEIPSKIEPYKCKPNGKIRPVLQYDLDNNFIKEWVSITTATKELGIVSISSVCLGKQKSAGGYIWRYKDIA